MGLFDIFRRKNKISTSGLTQILNGNKVPWNNPNVIYLAVEVVSEYGAILESNSTKFLVVSEKLLPYSKVEVENALEILLRFLTTKDSWDNVQNKYPDLIKFISTEEYYNSLRFGYIELAKFVSEDEAKIAEKVSYLFVDPDIPMDKFTNEIDSMSYNEFTTINKRITKESGLRLQYLNETYGD